MNKGMRSTPNCRLSSSPAPRDDTAPDSLGLARHRPRRAAGLIPAVPCGSVDRRDKPGGSRQPDARTAELARLEAVLLIAREPLSTRKLAQLADLADGTAARTLIRRLRKLYEIEGTAFQVEEIAGGYQLLSRPKFGPWLRRLFPHVRMADFRRRGWKHWPSSPYRQPVLRAEIESVRGVGCGEILRQLMDRDLVRIVGRASELGRPILYGTTRRFLQIFGLRNLDDLPRADILRRATAAPSLSDGVAAGSASAATDAACG